MSWDFGLFLYLEVILEKFGVVDVNVELFIFCGWNSFFFIKFFKFFLLRFFDI